MSGAEGATNAHRRWPRPRLEPTRARLEPARPRHRRLAWLEPARPARLQPARPRRRRLASCPSPAASFRPYAGGLAS